MRPTNFVTSVLLFAAATHAWPWGPVEQGGLLTGDVAPLAARAKTSFDLSFTGKQGDTATASPSSSSDSKSKGSASGSASGSSITGSASGSSSGKASGKASGSKKGDKKSSSKYQTTKTYDARLPAGGVEMITPAPVAQASYYKIKDHVTFAWNYTSLSATPSAVDILASCSLNNQIYTIAANQSITNATQAVTWDTGAYQTSASVTLLTAEYTLIIHDSEQDISATARAGYLATYEQFTFGMYSPQAYTPIGDFVCATCNGALSSIEKQAMGMVFGMAIMTVLSFGWFTGLVGLW